MAYIRTKKVKGKEYQYLVEGYRDKDGKVKQRTLKYLGAVDKSKAEYQNTGIPEYWIVDPIEQKITVLVLDKGSYTKTVFAGDEAIISSRFPQLKVTAEEILEA